MTDNALSRRIIKETQTLYKDPVPGISAVPHQDNSRYFDVVMVGPKDSPYENGVFKLELFVRKN